MKRIFALLLAVLMLAAVLTGCGSKHALSGRFDATSCTSSEGGTVYSCDGEYLLFNTDGTGTFCFIDSDLTIEWNLTNETLTFTDEDGDIFSGTYDETAGTITGSIGGLDYTFSLSASSDTVNN